MIRFLSTPLVLVALWSGLPVEARAWSSPASKTYHKVRILELMIEEFRSDHGKFPGQEEFRSGLQSEDRPVFEDRYPFIDHWHREIIYRIPGIHAEFDLYSTGANGIDDKGAKDDISSWRGVNDGYYWMKWWPLGRFTLIGSILLGIFLLASKTPRLRPMAVPLAGIFMGLGIGIGCFLLLHPGVVRERNLPLSITSLAGFIIFLISVAKLRKLIACLRYLRDRSTQKPSGAG